MRAESRTPGGTGGFGGNLGAALRVPGGTRVGLELEGRLFLFGTRTLAWQPAESRPLSPLEQTLLAATLERLPQASFVRPSTRSAPDWPRGSSLPHARPRLN